MDIKKVVIVGGGTAGWLAANHLGKELLKREGVSVTLIESPDIPPIGVGEGTVPDIRQTLLNFGISETDFIRECDATFKQSIKFVNWMDKNTYGDGNFYHHLFDVPNSSHAKILTEHWLNQKNTDKHYAHNLSSQHLICEHGLAPKDITTPEYQADLAYAYHLNAGKFAQLLAKNAKEKYQVEHILANVKAVKCDNNGFISNLITDVHGELAFDFYIDCSGFDSILLSKTLNIPFISVADSLLVDSALVVQVPTQPEDNIPPYTIATAHQAGWIWDIALSSRRGVGFVYSSKHITDEKAKLKFDKYLGEKCQDLSYRKISMKVGFREKFWHKNCVALGLAQGFLEPLEATSILLTDFCAKFLTQRFPHNRSQIEYLEQRFNHSMQYAWQRVVDFIKLHYCISDRTDSSFWIENKESHTIPQTLKDRLTLWKDFVPVKDDFFSQFEVFYLENFLFVLYGMGYSTDVIGERKATDSDMAEYFERKEKIDEFLKNKLPKHRDLLEKIKKFGLQNI
ncbi:Flavin-dependent tryptophan halogenase RebH [Pseudoalteromonas sp. CIP111854]|uniref:Flavin-dependent tryptophan halogenase RebH n=1 Tax=Pseudoalteromonas holothuriae TaxID=2963714 RepID=A0A9W4QXS2_9GAMM|nr:tryptophan halogenase family protein [Pseudoalteromonas sp. CIP111854]CAH9057410.1 Flavin-dependent tryptophan halogenase RebH [Pseudoalteromonas sp. CIP111854]